MVNPRATTNCAKATLMPIAAAKSSEAAVVRPSTWPPSRWLRMMVPAPRKLTPVITASMIRIGSLVKDSLASYHSFLPSPAPREPRALPPRKPACAFEGRPACERPHDPSPRARPGTWPKPHTPVSEFEGAALFNPLAQGACRGRAQRPRVAACQEKPAAPARGDARPSNNDQRRSARLTSSRPYRFCPITMYELLPPRFTSSNTSPRSLSYRLFILAHGGNTSAVDFLDHVAAPQAGGSRGLRANLHDDHAASLRRQVQLTRDVGRQVIDCYALQGCALASLRTGRLARVPGRKEARPR